MIEPLGRAIPLGLVVTFAAACATTSEVAPTASGRATLRAGGDRWYVGAPSAAVASEEAPARWYTGSAWRGEPDERANGARSRRVREAAPTVRRRATRLGSDEARVAAAPAEGVVESSDSDPGGMALQLGIAIPVPIGEPFGQNLDSVGADVSPPLSLRLRFGSDRFNGGALLLPDVAGSTAFGGYFGFSLSRFRLGPLLASIGMQIDLLFVSRDVSENGFGGSSAVGSVLALVPAFNLRVRYPLSRALSLVGQFDSGGAFLAQFGGSGDSTAGGLLFGLSTGAELSF